MNRLAFTGAALAVVLSAAAAQAEPLTFDAALEKARSNAPSLRAKGAGSEAARAARGAAGALPDPKLSLGYDSFPISGPLAFQPSRDNFSWVRVGVSQDIPNAAKRHARQARADTDIIAADAEGEAEMRLVEVGTAVAWITLAYAEKRLAALDVVRARLNRLVRTTPSAVASGNARPAQVLAGRQALAGLDDRRDELVAGVARARADLTRWTDDRRPEIAGTTPEFSLDDVRLRAGVDSHPTIGMAVARVGQAAADVRLAQAERRPDFGVDVSYQRRDPRFGDYVSAGVTIGLPLWKKYRQEPLIAARQADAARFRAEQEAARRTLAFDLDAGLAEHAADHARWERSRDTIEPLARQRVELETAGYAAGRTGLVDIVDAHGALANAVLDTLDRQAAVAIDGARLTLTYRSAAR